MPHESLWSRRSMLRLAGAGTLGALAPLQLDADSPVQTPAHGPIKGNIKQSVCRWCYGNIPLDQFAAAVARIGFKSIDLLSPDEYKVIKPHGLTCALLKCNSIGDGLNRKENHARIEQELRTNIEFAAAEGLPNVICMSGNRKGMSDAEGLANCAVGLKRVVGLAEAKKVTIVMEGLNSTVDHKDYMYDHTRWGLELVKTVGSPRFRLLYDIYHMQIMEGDVIRTIRDNKDAIAHYHTGGVPGRHEIDETQELNYPAIIRAIVDTGFQGYLAQEFIPAHEPLTSLAQGFRICDV